MPKSRKPRAGSLQYWPRKRAGRIYPDISFYPEVPEAKPLLFAGYKAGMTQVTIIDNKAGSPSKGQEIIKPVTVLETPSLFVLGVRAYSPSSVQDVFCSQIPKKIKKFLPHNFPEKSKKELKRENLKDVRLIVCTQPMKTGTGKKKAEVFEAGIGGKLEDKITYALEKIGKEIVISEVYKDGEWIDSVAVTKGHGFQGVVKRYGVKLQGRKNEQHHRHIGIRGSRGVGRILYTIPQPGQHGFHRRTEFNKRIVKIGTNPGEVNPKGGFVNYGEVKNDFVLLEGSVPGHKKRLIMMRAAVRAPKSKFPVNVKEINTLSQQGR